MKKCKHDYLLNNGPRCIDCLITERDRLKERMKIEFEGYKDDTKAFIEDKKVLLAEISRWKAEVEAIRHNCFCTEKVMEENRRLSKEWDQVHDLNNQYVAERFKLKAKAEKLAGALRTIRSGFCEGNAEEHGKCEEWMRDVSQAALEGEGL